MTAARSRRLRGDPAVARQTAPPQIVAAGGHSTTSCEDFVSQLLEDARRAHLLLDDAPWQQALKNYMRVAFHSDRGGPRSLPMAHYQQLVAYVDEVIFDAYLPGENAAVRLERLSDTASYLAAAARGAAPRRRTGARGAAKVATAALALRRMRARYRRHGDGRIFAGWVRSLVALFAASVEEHCDWPCGRPLDCGCHAGSPLQRRISRAVQRAPAAIRAELAQPEQLLGEHTQLCVTVLLRLCCTAASIGAGGLFWSAALMERGEIAHLQLRALEEACTLLDYLVRLDNDLSDAVRLPGGDRDGKSNCVTIVMGTAPSPQRREEAIVAARRCRWWLDELFEDSLRRLVACWPEMGGCMARGAAIGEAIYTELGHFKEVSAEQMAEVARSLDERWR